MKKTGNTFFSLFLALAGALALVIGCSNPMLTTSSTGSPTDGTGSPTDGPSTGSGTEPGSVGEPVEPPITGEADIPAGGGTGTLTVALEENWGASRSVSGADSGEIINGVGTLRNIYQMILVDNGALGKIWDFDQAVGDTQEALKVSAQVAAGATYHILLLTGHKDHPDDPAEKPTLLASGYAKALMQEGHNTITFPMTAIVVGMEAVPGDSTGDIRQPGRLARTVGLDARVSYILRYTIGSQSRASFGDALRTVTGDGLAPLKKAEDAVIPGPENWPGLNLVDNYAEYDNLGVILRLGGDYNDSTGTGVAEYQFDDPGAADPVNTRKVFFHMEYAPFGMGDFSDTGPWADWPYFNAWFHGTPAPGTWTPPTWVIRNGLNDDEQTPAAFDLTTGAVTDYGTDFAAYPATGNANGAVSIGVVNPAARPVGLFEDNNPWPIANSGITGQSDGDLDSALSYLNAAGAKGKYGEYTIRLGVAPTLPANDGKITLGGSTGSPSDAAPSYTGIKNTSIVIEGAGIADIVLPRVPDLWTLTSGDTVRYGSGIVPPVAAPDITPLSNRAYGLSEPTAALSVTASSVDGGVLSYQWYKSATLPGSTAAAPDTGNPGAWTAINGATDAALAAGNIGTATANRGKTYYYVKVTNTGNGMSESLASNAAAVWVQTLAERVTAAAGSGLAGSPTVITLYQSELLADGNGFAAVQAANIGAGTHISIVSSNTTERFVQLDISGGVGDMFNIAGGGSLVLGGRVTLLGDYFANAKPLVYVSGGGFTLGGSAKITGNRATNGGGVYITGSGSSFTMDGSTEIIGNRATKGGGVYVDTNGTFTMSGVNAKISGNEATDSGGGVYLAGGSEFTMSGESGQISGNTSGTSGGGVYLLGGATFTMSAGNISGNISGANGGGVYVDNSTFTMSGELVHISRNTAGSDGGGVYLADGAEFTMSGYSAQIYGNTSSDYAGGVYLTGGAQFAMSGTSAQINGNTAGYEGGGVYVNGTFTMPGTNAQISGNIAEYEGGGVVVNGIFTMSGMNARISDNTAGSLGGGVYVDTNGTFTMSGMSQLSGNTAGFDGGGVYLNNLFGGTGSRFNMSGGEIFGNKTKGGLLSGAGGGVMVNAGSDNKFTMTGGTIYGYTGGTNASGVFRAGNEANLGATDGASRYSAALYGGVILPNGGRIGSTSYTGPYTYNGSTSDTIRGP